MKTIKDRLKLSFIWIPEFILIIMFTIIIVINAILSIITLLIYFYWLITGKNYLTISTDWLIDKYIDIEGWLK